MGNLRIFYYFGENREVVDFVMGWGKILGYKNKYVFGLYFWYGIF